MMKRGLGSKHGSKHNHHGTSRQSHRNKHQKDVHEQKENSEDSSEVSSFEENIPEMKPNGMLEFDFTLKSAVEQNKQDNTLENYMDTDILNTQIDSTSNTTRESEFRWAAEFMSGPGGYMEKAEIVSRWFGTLAGAKEDAYMKAEKEMQDYPFSRGKILKLIIEDKNGNITVLENVKDNVPQR